VTLDGCDDSFIDLNHIKSLGKVLY
jgi:hypothetical protein